MEQKIFIDFDGVIFNTEKELIKQKKNKPNMTWDKFLEQVDWLEIIKKSPIIENAINYIKIAQNESKQIYIITKIHTIEEGVAKTEALRYNNINVPILLVPQNISKSQIYLPLNGEVLIDDNINNLIEWEEKGGKSIYFSATLELSDFKTIKTLKKIL